MFLVVLGVFRCHFWLTFGAKDGSRSGFGGIEKMMQKKVWGNFGNFGVAVFPDLFELSIVFLKLFGPNICESIPVDLADLYGII